MAIQKNIIQTCRDKRQLTRDYVENIENIKNLNAGWKHYLFDDSEVKDFFSSYFGAREKGLLSKINKNYGVVLADIFRYAFIHKFGGVYLDIKSTTRLNLDHSLPKDSKFIISQWRNKLGQKFCGWGLHTELIRIPGGEFQQWHVIAENGHCFLSYVLEQVFKNIETYDPIICGVGRLGVLRLSGPICYTLTVYPIIRRYQCTVCDAVNLGLHYSIYENMDLSRHAQAPSHYSKLTEPIIN